MSDKRQSAQCAGCPISRVTKNKAEDMVFFNEYESIHLYTYFYRFLLFLSYLYKNAINCVYLLFIMYILFM